VVVVVLGGEDHQVEDANALLEARVQGAALVQARVEALDLFYGEYSNRVRGSGGPGVPAGEEQRKSKRASPSWGRMIAKVYQVDPLVCTRCGKRMSIIAFVTDQAAIGRILDHLGLSTPEAEKPPPPAPEVLRVAEHGDGWGVPAEWE